MTEGKPSPWVTAVAIVRHDYRAGHVLEMLYPPTALTASQQHQLLSMALPEHCASGDYSAQHAMRIYPEVDAPGYGRSLRAAPCLHGFVEFWSKTEARLARGVSQRSLVLVTPYPFDIFKRLASLFSHALLSLPAATVGTEALTRACTLLQCIRSW